MRNKEIYDCIVAKLKKGSRVCLMLRDMYPEIFAHFRSCNYVGHTSKDLYDYLVPEAEKVCKCGGLLGFDGFSYGYKTFCSMQCPAKIENLKEKRQATWMDKYGVDNPFKSREVREAHKRKYGVETPLERPEVQEMKRNTMITRYGDTAPLNVPSIREKKRKTMQTRYGVDYSGESAYLRQKAILTCVSRYGVENPLQSPEILRKNLASGYRSKYVNIGGVEFCLQGYEPQAILYMVETYGIHPSVLKEAKESIPYKDGDKTRRYTPDFVAGNLVIEVKSPYTSGLIGEARSKSLTEAKLLGARNAGYDTLLLVMNKDGSVYSMSYNGDGYDSALSQSTFDCVKMNLTS